MGPSSGPDIGVFNPLRNGGLQTRASRSRQSPTSAAHPPEQAGQPPFRIAPLFNTSHPRAIQGDAGAFYLLVGGGGDVPKVVPAIGALHRRPGWRCHLPAKITFRPQWGSLLPPRLSASAGFTFFVAEVYVKPPGSGAPLAACVPANDLKWAPDLRDFPDAKIGKAA
ncbi:hypothetical protein GWK47_014417 [Chionoecetes opilio]|uniref:Uncharacterized protein n=1 Tax=Chionoecetes opilio TaxID=41210 RepID=A0A8J4Y059_CHIOP|nr:hypothetical protein GWK47_014417 [Chionoecetes opilio]